MVVSRSLPALFVASLVLLFGSSAKAQTAPHRVAVIDTPNYALPPQDSLRALDSMYRVRKAMIERWVVQNAIKTPHPQQDFLSIYGATGAYLKIRANDINEYFSDRAGRPDPKGDRDQLSTIDRSLLLQAQAQLDRGWGIYVEYDYLAHDFNTIVDDASVPMFNKEESLTFAEHSLVTGAMLVLYSSQFYRLRATGGLGATFIHTTEAETGVASRDASATGYQFNIDLLNDFRVVDWGSVTLDLLSRSISAGTLKTSSGETLNAPLGTHTSPFPIAPKASNLVFGLGLGIVLYF